MNKRLNYMQFRDNNGTNAYTHRSYFPEDELKFQLNRYKHAYTEFINKMIKFDKEKIFRSPVDITLVPDYPTVIKKPMDFETMIRKNEEKVYQDDVKIFDDDVSLIINNCKTYNSPDTIFYKAAIRLEEYYAKIRPIYLKKINDISGIIRRRCYGINNRSSRLHKTSVTSNSSDSSFHKNGARIPGSKAEGRNDRSMAVKRSKCSETNSETSQDHTTVIKRRRRCVDYIKDKLSDGNRNYDKSNPIIYAIQIALSIVGLTNESFGKLLNSPNGLAKLVNALDVVNRHMSMTQYSKSNWYLQSLIPLKRLISNFEWKRTYEFPIMSAKNSTFRKIQTLMSRLKKDTYKGSVEKFIGKENLETINEIYPSLTDTLNDLSLSYQLIGHPVDIKF